MKTKNKLAGVLALNLLTALAGANSDYQAGHLAMAKQNWSEAVEKFAAASKDPDLADSATYWQAYVLYQNRQNGRARALLKKLQAEYPNSQWIDDAQVLMAEHGDLTVIPPQPIKPALPPRVTDDVAKLIPPIPPVAPELRLFAIQQLMEKNPQKAIGMVKEMLSESAPDQSKSNALHILGIADAPEATAMLYEFIEEAKNIELKAQAIQMIGLRGGVENQRRLTELYQQAKEKAVKSAIINSFIHLDNGQMMERLLNKESDPELSQQMIHILGAMGDADVLKKLYKHATELSKKTALLESLAMAGESEIIKNVIANEDDKELRQSAIHALLILGEGNSEYALDLYQQAQDLEEKRTLATMLMITDVEPGVISGLYQEANDAELKRTLLAALMSQQDFSSLESLYLNEKDAEMKKEILQHLGVMGETKRIKKLADRDPEVKKTEGYYMAFGMGDDEDRSYLVSQYAAADANGKERILHALMMQGDVQWLLKVYRQTDDKEDKKQVLKTIGMLDPEALLDLIEEK